MLENRKIGFIGLGTMGSPMVRQILKKGFSVSIYDIRYEAIKPLLKADAQEAKSIQEIAENCGTIITMLPDTPNVEEVLVGQKGVINYAPAGTIAIDMSTISPFVTQKIAEKLGRKGIEMLDAPVSGGPTMAERGELVIMVGGPKDVFDESQKILQCLGKKVVYMGAQGSGQTVKLCNQIICALNIQAICEALSLARARNIDLHKMIEVLKGGAAGSWMMENLAPLMLAGDASPRFTIKLLLKDLRLAVELSQHQGIPLPGASLVKNLYLEAVAHGEGDKGHQALFRVYERLTGRNLKPDKEG